MLKFGITERGDIAFHDGWIAPLENREVAAAILISKGLPTSERAREAIRKNASRIIFHATTTGYGGTMVEPGVKPYDERLTELVDFLKEVNLPMSHVVIRVDPIIPTRKGIERAKAVIRKAYSLGFRRFRYSWMDIYGHVRERFQRSGLPIPPTVKEADQKLISEFVDEFCARAEENGCTFESCAELNRHQAGCVSVRDYKLCGLDPAEAIGKSQQRSACMCCGTKTELLNHKGRCAHNCLYCYWR